MDTHTKHEMKAHAGHYRGLAIMAALSFVAMYALMYAMVDRFANVHNSLNQAYMAGLMTAPMLMFELLLMRSMYRNAKSNAVVVIGGALLLVGCFAAIRTQAGISDKQFLRSMIPHHAGALLMCEQAALHDPEVKALCERIRASQQSEIELMEAKLRELDR